MLVRGGFAPLYDYSQASRPCAVTLTRISPLRGHGRLALATDLNLHYYLTMPNTPTLALIPAYNEASRIEPVIAGTLPQLPVLVIDDGSKDNSAEIARRAGATVVQQPQNKGKGEALRAGFQWALAQGFDAVITLDADGQHNPAEIPTFLDCHRRTQADLIIGARNFREMPTIRRAANLLGSKLLSWAMRYKVLDNQSGYRLLSRRMMAATLASAEGGFEFEVEMIITCVNQGLRLEWVPIQTIYGDESSHINPVDHFTNFLGIVWETRQRTTQQTRQ